MTLPTACSVAGNGQPLIMVNGIGARRATFDAVVSGLKDRFTCIPHDLRGHGLTRWTGGRFDLEDLPALFGIKSAHISGRLLGGMIGPRYVPRHLARVKSLGIWSTAALRTDDFCAARPDVMDWRKKQGMDTPSDVFLNAFDIDATSEMSPRAHKAKVPAQTIPCKNDGGCTPRLNRLIHRALPGSDLVILPHLKHAIFIKATDQALPDVRDFLLKQG